MNPEPATTPVVVEDVGHVHHSSVVDVELSHSEHPRQLHPLDEHRRRDAAERDGDAHAELDVGFRPDWTLDGQVDGGRGAVVGDDRDVRWDRLSARQLTRKQVLYVVRASNYVTVRSSDNADNDSGDVRRVLFRIPDVTVMSSTGQLGHTEDADPRRNSDSRSVVVERRVQHELVVAAVLHLPPAVSSHRVRRRSPHVAPRPCVRVVMVPKDVEHDDTVYDQQTRSDTRL